MKSKYAAKSNDDSWLISKGIDIYHSLSMHFSQTPVGTRDLGDDMDGATPVAAET